MKRGEEIELHIDDIGTDGEGIAHCDGCTVFLPFAAAGERVLARVNFVKKNLAFADLIRVIEPSADRVKPPCRYFTVCGGCDIQHLAPTAQAKFKRDKLINTLRKALGSNMPEVENTVSGNNSFYYRNKFQAPFGFNGKVVLGFFQKNSHKVVPIESCMLHADWADRLMAAVLGWANSCGVSVYDEASGTGLLRHLAARYIGGRLFITLVINGDGVPRQESLILALRQKFPDFALYFSPNKKNTNVIFGDTAKLICGEEKAVTVNGLEMRLHPLSFLQVNDEVRENLYVRVLDSLAGSDVVIDAYSGAGILTALIAKRLENARVYGIEIVKEAVLDADRLMAENGLCDRVTNILGDAAVELPKLISKLSAQSNEPVVSVVLDPPRKGCDSAVISALLDAKPHQIIYVSCNPATLARDLALLAPAYQITSITPLDMFPQTSHVECVVLMSRV
jgi:23S rRNA (uracil1939-C5)-methyltransferase